LTTFSIRRRVYKADVFFATCHRPVANFANPPQFEALSGFQIQDFPNENPLFSGILIQINAARLRNSIS